MRLSLCILFAAVLVVGCGRGSAKKEKVKEGVEVSNNPAVATSQIQKAADKIAELTKEIQEMKPVPPVAYEKLIELLPPAPEGFKAEKPRGEKLEIQDFKHSFAERNYSGDGKSLYVKIHDAAGNGPLYMGVAAGSQFKNENTEGYNKGVTIDGNPGVESYQNANKNGNLQVMVGKRFLVTVETRGMPPEFVRTVYGTIDTKKLAELK